MYDHNTTINDFLMATAAKQPTPGGGSVTALAGALAAAMGEMVLNYSVGKKDLANFQADITAGLAELARARALLLGLMAEDQVAYEALTAARKLPANSPNRQNELDVALVACIRVPQAMGATALAILAEADRLVDKVNVHLLSDLAVCCELAMATVRSAGYNVRVNMPDLQDPRDRDRVQGESDHLISRATHVVSRAVGRIWARHGRETAGK
jgi:formiminotetrahydrofolate cyclodeaminase